MVLEGKSCGPNTGGKSGKCSVVVQLLLWQCLMRYLETEGKSKTCLLDSTKCNCSSAVKSINCVGNVIISLPVPFMCIRCLDFIMYVNSCKILVP